MIPELGHYCLILALCLAGVQALVPLFGAQRGNLRWMHLARPCAYGQLLFIALAFLALVYAFVRNDFSVAYVAANSHSQLPLLYRIGAVWGAHEGSLLLWVLLLAAWEAAVACFSRSLPLAMVARVLAIMGMVASGFLLFLLLTSNPFLRLLPGVPTEGRDLNPLLQDPGLMIHPPLLYMGYVGFCVVFAFAIAALIAGRLDAAWARWSKPWALVAWCFLTCGVILGSWWAYRELGWGGWWFWDPVENASFLPWLVGTALIHSLAVTDKRNAFKAWTVLLAIMAFSLSLLGTFLVRSGVLVSVHAFAVDPQRGIFMLLFLGAVVGLSLLLYAWRIGKVRNPVYFGYLSRESMLLINNLLLVAAMLTVLLGTLYPLIIDSLGLGKISVGPPYFNWVFTPFMMLVALVMGLAASTRWRYSDNRHITYAVMINFFIAMVLGLALPWLLAPRMQPGVVIGLGLAIWVVLFTLESVVEKTPRFVRVKKLSRSQWGMVVAHVGVAVCIVGVVLVSHYSVQRDVRLMPEDTLELGGYTFQFLGVRTLQGANYSGVQGEVLVSHNQRPVALLTPEQRVFNAGKTALAKTAIDMGLFRDVYVALGEPLAQNAWSLRIYIKPFIRWIWGGGLLMALGGVLALSDRRYRIPLKKVL